MLKRSLIVLLLAIGIIACSSDNGDGNNGGTTDNFDRSTLLTNVADNIIIPAFQDLESKLSTLQTSITTFVATPNASNLNTVQTNWLTAYKVWQHVEMFNIGKAEEINQYYYYMNIYPVTVSDIDSAAGGTAYDLATINYQDAQGFPGLDYLIHGVASGDSAAIDKFTTNSNASGYLTYLSDVITRMKSLTSEVLNDWTSSYRDEFIANTANTATGALNKLVNDFVFYYEKGFRANKIGIPAGNFSSTTLPEKVEAYYKQDVSRELALDAMTAIQNMFNGKAYNSSSTGASFKTYLEALDRSDLVTSITSQFNTAKSSIQGLNANFYQQINTDNTQMTQAYDAIQTAVPYLKVDMVQAFNIAIDYVDADGD